MNYLLVYYLSMNCSMHYSSPSQIWGFVWFLCRKPYQCSCACGIYWSAHRRMHIVLGIARVDRGVWSRRWCRHCCWVMKIVLGYWLTIYHRCWRRISRGKISHHCIVGVGMIFIWMIRRRKWSWIDAYTSQNIALVGIYNNYYYMIRWKIQW